MYYPYSDSPELRRVAKAQEVLSDVSKLVIFNWVKQLSLSCTGIQQFGKTQLFASKLIIIY